MLSPIILSVFMLIRFLPRPLGSRPGSRPAFISFILVYYRLIRAMFAIGPRPVLCMANRPMRRATSRARVFALPVSFGLICAAAASDAVGLNDLLNQKDLTPEGFARVCADFAFELAPQVQAPDAFLKRKCGDCVDFSSLASTVLNHRGYTTKLVVVMMPNQTHVVCYVKEAGGFLDYNHRADAHPVVPSDGSLEDIAGKVSSDFRSDWRMASAFRYGKGAPVYLDTVFPTASALASSPGKTAGKRAGKLAKTSTGSRIDVPKVDADAPVRIQAVIN
jgi:hypothetical protein